MKKAKINLDLPATKRDLLNLATKKELEKLAVATKMEMGRMELRLEKKFDEQDEKARQYRDQMLNAIDPIAKEISDTREERAVTAYQREQDREAIDGHEERISVLEQKVTVFPS